jgi:isoleucyl-tRNA synthetase
VQSFCLEAERFVDDRLSNWYVRRNRRRFWKSEMGDDKSAAYQTLHTVLLTLAKLFAPIMPFLAEVMYRNLVPAGAGKASIHLESYPEPDEALIDAKLSEDMDALLRLVSLGSAARNAAKIKVRQPLAELRFRPANGSEKQALMRFEEQVTEELNIKKIEFCDENELEKMLKPAPRQSVKKKFGPDFGRLSDVLEKVLVDFQNAGHSLAKLGWPTDLVGKNEYSWDAAGFAALMEFAKKNDADNISLWEQLEAGDVSIRLVSPSGWETVVNKGTYVQLCTVISQSLAQEGMAREVVRHIQQARKNAGLEMEDRILLYLSTDTPELERAIDAHRDYIANETLVKEWATRPLSDSAYCVVAKVDDKKLTIDLSKTTAKEAQRS